MMNKKKHSALKRIYMLTAVILLTLTASFSLTACGKSNIPENTVFSVDDLAGKSVGVQLGTTGDMMPYRHLSRAKLMLLLSMHSLLKHLLKPTATFACLTRIS